MILGKLLNRSNIRFSRKPYNRLYHLFSTTACQFQEIRRTQNSALVRRHEDSQDTYSPEPEASRLLPPMNNGTELIPHAFLDTDDKSGTPPVVPKTEDSLP